MVAQVQWRKTMVVALASLSPCCMQQAAPEERIPPVYAFLLEGGHGDDQEADSGAGLPYERIEWSCWNPWFGGDSISFDVDGSAFMADQEGDWKGNIGLFEFGHLCYLLETSAFHEMEARYERDIFDATTVTVRAWPR